MANLVVRNIDDAIANALKIRAILHGTSAEEEHRRILVQVLMPPQKKSFTEVICEIPDVGEDSDFSRKQGDDILEIFASMPDDFMQDGRNDLPPQEK